ncbi:nuclear transport factor 2 family protein [Saccharopolyspora sp. NFXS83]|uniref:nuclear transport factor 2 family protein n=1 Tax=Saccharopolyspora sp. NFXS83 TaxID=2993560 RepID=UPI00224A8B11|nr:nuclear transport factor 2 family protein [Saccharopolyspora sp. NFXS83]MCX2728779.1 nuclear transport factor 2 family protein [Saccharopolyspora sp. NFXS83]
MTTPTTPADVIDRFTTLLLAKDMAGAIDLFAPDIVFEAPFAAGTPARVDGRDGMREYLDGYPDRVDITGFPAYELHETTDPEKVIAEFTAHGRTVRTGEPYVMHYIAVLTVRDGLITHYRDYWSPVLAAQAAGELPALVESLEARA